MPTLAQKLNKLHIYPSVRKGKVTLFVQNPEDAPVENIGDRRTDFHGEGWIESVSEDDDIWVPFWCSGEEGAFWCQDDESWVEASATKVQEILA